MKFKNFTKYEIYEDGRIWSYSHNKWLKPATRKDGYQTVSLVDNDGKNKMYYVHRIVWEAVTRSPIPPGYEINHRSEVKTENMITNLELMSPKQNSNYGTRNSRIAESKSKQVGAFKNGNLVTTFQSIKEAHRNGFNSGAVSACCRNCYNREGNNKYKGFEWKYI